MKRFELVCANRTRLAMSQTLFGLPLYLGTKSINWSMDRFPSNTVFKDRGDYVTAFFTTPRGVRREIDIFEKEKENE